MENVRNIILLILISTASFGQVIQERNASGADRRIILKNGFRLPQVCNVSGNPDLLNYSAFDSKGAMVFDTCAGKIKRWSGSAWVAVADSGASGGGNDYVDTIYRKAGQDSIFYTINGGAERAVKDSVGGGGSSGVNYITADKAYVGITSGNGSNGTDGGTNANGFNILIGDSAAASITGNTNSIAIGAKALKSITTDFSSGTVGSIAIGTNALENLTQSGAVGANNVGAIAIGQDALKSNTISTSANLAIGRAALSLVTTGGGNVGIGTRSLTSATGSRNTSIGFAANAAQTTGDNITAIGSQSLFAGAAVGNNNTAIGYFAMGNQTAPGAQNTAIGSEALFGTAGHTGANNIAIGYRSLYSVQSGAAGNVAIGLQSGFSITTGLRNLIISGITGGNVTTGFRNIMIGDRPTVASATGNDQMTIGNSINMNSSGQTFFNLDRSSGEYPTTAPTFKASVAFEVSSVGQTGRGMYTMPLTSAQRNAISSPQAGLWITNTTLSNQINFNNGTAWLGINQQVGNEAITGNKTITATTGTHLHMVDATSGNITITLPTMTAGYVGVEYQFIRTDASANTVTVTRAGSNTINNAATSFTIAARERAYVIGVNNSNTFTWHAGRLTNY